MKTPTQPTKGIGPDDGQGNHTPERWCPDCTGVLEECSKCGFCHHGSPGNQFCGTGTLQPSEPPLKMWCEQCGYDHVAVSRLDLDKQIDGLLYGYYQAQLSAGGKTRYYRELIKQRIIQARDTSRKQALLARLNQIDWPGGEMPYEVEKVIEETL